jgi:hypothetical protein
LKELKRKVCAGFKPNCSPLTATIARNLKTNFHLNKIRMKLILFFKKLTGNVFWKAIPTLLRGLHLILNQIRAKTKLKSRPLPKNIKMKKFNKFRPKNKLLQKLFSFKNGGEEL